MSTPDQLQKINRRVTSGNIFEAIAVLAEALCNETRDPVVEVEVFHKPCFSVLSLHCARYLCPRESTCSSSEDISLYTACVQNGGHGTYGQGHRAYC
jgi:hypothetical protein